MVVVARAVNNNAGLLFRGQGGLSSSESPRGSCCLLALFDRLLLLQWIGTELLKQSRIDLSIERLKEGRAYLHLGIFG